MRIIGIDPGTRSFDFFGKDGDEILIDATVPSEDVAADSIVIVETIRKLLPLDLIVGPSGYGLPLTEIKDLTPLDVKLMCPLDGSVPVNEGIRKVVQLMKDEGMPVVFTPQVVQLSTVPLYRKANKCDMGTADKVCCVAMGVRDQAEALGIGYDETSFVLAEVGHGFNAAFAVSGGAIVDGVGGTSGGPGFLTLGTMDSEIAMRTDSFPQISLFTGGAGTMTGRADMTPEILVAERERYTDAWNMLIESVVKNIAAMLVPVPEPREILLTGRLTDMPEVYAELGKRLARYGKVRKLKRRDAAVAKEAAEGAYVIGEGLAGGNYRGIVESLALRQAKGTMFDHILMQGVDVRTPLKD